MRLRPPASGMVCSITRRVPTRPKPTAWSSASTGASSARCWGSRSTATPTLEIVLRGFNAAYKRPPAARAQGALARDGTAPASRSRSRIGQPNLQTAQFYYHQTRPLRRCRCQGGLASRHYRELADLAGADDDQTGVWTRGLLIRRSLSDGERAYFTTWCPAGTPIATPGGGRGPALDDRGRVRDRQDRAWAGSQRDPLLARPGTGTSAW